MRSDEPLEKRTLHGDDFCGEGERQALPMVAVRGRLEPDDRLSRGRVKIAAAEDAIKLASELVPEPGKCYILLIGLGSTEFWGPNNNGDGWPENALTGRTPVDVAMSFFDRFRSRLPKVWGYTTFRKAHVFEEHRNSNKKWALGGVCDTFWNPRMHRVENLIWFDRHKGKKWAERADKGDNVASSMAAKVPFDRCSCCGNLAPTRMQYCNHLKAGREGYALRQIRDDGKPVMMINDFPDFFDESLVENPAAPEAMSIMKVASETAKVAGDKPATIVKEDLDLPADIAMDELTQLADREPKIASAVLDRLAPLGLTNVLAASERLGMCLKPSEVFQVTFGHKLASESCDRQVLHQAPDPAPLDLPQIAKAARGPLLERSDIAIAKAASLLLPYAPMRSYHEPHISPRRMKVASAPVIPTPLCGEDQAALAVYHALYKLAAGNFGYGLTQVTP